MSGCTKGAYNLIQLTMMMVMMMMILLLQT
jgi:hypothetical protein